jgi:protease I
MNKRIAILATDGFEESELQSPKEAIEKQGWQAEIVSLKSGMIKSWSKGDWGKEYSVDNIIDDVKASEYDGLMIPGGVINPDKLRRENKVLDFVKDFFEAKKPVAAICHGPQVLISAGVVSGRELTSFESVKIDLQNAGASWLDEEVVVDNGLVTSRSPQDLPAFNKKMIEEFREGTHTRETK